MIEITGFEVRAGGCKWGPGFTAAQAEVGSSNIRNNASDWHHQHSSHSCAQV